MAEETNIRTGGVEVHNHDNHDHDNPDVYFENNASEAAIVGSGKVNNAEEVRLNGESSRRDLGNETTQEKSKKTNNPEAEKNATSKKDEKDSKLEASHPLKGEKAKKKDSKKLLSSPWILILTILILFVLACIILAVLEFNRRSAVP